MLERYVARLTRLQFERHHTRRVRFYGILLTAAGLILTVFQWL